MQLLLLAVTVVWATAGAIALHIAYKLPYSQLSVYFFEAASHFIGFTLGAGICITIVALSKNGLVRIIAASRLTVILLSFVITLELYHRFVMHVFLGYFGGPSAPNELYLAADWRVPLVDNEVGDVKEFRRLSLQYMVVLLAGLNAPAPVFTLPAVLFP
jgi:hypothetical protein